MCVRVAVKVRRSFWKLMKSLDVDDDLAEGARPRAPCRRRYDQRRGGDPRRGPRLRRGSAVRPDHRHRRRARRDPDAVPPERQGHSAHGGPLPSSTAAVDKGAVTYLARRLSEEKTPEGGKLWEFGVIGHGPGSDELTAKVADAIRTWDREYRDREAAFEMQPLDAPVIDQRAGLFALDTPLNRIVVDWQ